MTANELAIVDAHHHLWDPVANYHPWLRDEPMIPFRYGDYSTLRRPFMPAHYEAATANWNIVATVTMEGEWDATDPLGEARWLDGLSDHIGVAAAEGGGLAAAHVAQAWLDRPDIGDLLAAYADMPRVRSVRHKPPGSDHPGAGASAMTQAAYADGFARLAEHELHFDLQAPWWHLDDVPQMARGREDTTIILNHAGLPSDRSEAGLAGWRSALTRFARLPNTLVKISGLGLPGQPWRVEDNRDIICQVIDIFGPARAMFASNFPVDGLCGSFDTIFGGFDTATRSFSADERGKLFGGTASRTYLGPLPAIKTGLRSLLPDQARKTQE